MKLIRDKIPEKNGRQYFTIHETREFESLLTLKLYEEVHELVSETLDPGKNDGEIMEEMADVIEVLDTIAAHHGFSLKEVEHIRERKAEIKGTFHGRRLIV